jgi:hypothetical protein
MHALSLFAALLCLCLCCGASARETPWAPRISSLASKMSKLPATIKERLIGRNSIHLDDVNLIEFGSPEQSRGMRAVVRRLEQTWPGARVHKYDVESDEEHKRSYTELVGALGGRYILPLYYNRRSQSILYGPTDYPNFEKWASGMREFQGVPPLYDYNAIRKTGAVYKFIGYIAQKIVERLYTSNVPSCKIYILLLYF